MHAAGESLRRGLLGVWGSYCSLWEDNVRIWMVRWVVVELGSADYASMPTMFVYSYGVLVGGRKDTFDV